MYLCDNFSQPMAKSQKKFLTNEKRSRLERDTAAYFARLRGNTAQEESRLESALASLVDEINFDA